MVDTRFSMSVQIMTSLAFHESVTSRSELMSSEDFAGILKSNPTFIRKLISRLVQAGLIKSFRGKGGGIKINKAAKEITLKDIYIASVDDKPLISTHQKPVYKSCSVSCSMSEILCEVTAGLEENTRQHLSNTKLSDLVGKIKKKNR
jgi:Rrf2 family protein